MTDTIHQTRSSGGIRFGIVAVALIAFLSGLSWLVLLAAPTGIVLERGPDSAAPSSMVPETGPAGAPPLSEAPTPDSPDLGVTFIQREPLYYHYQVEYQTHDRTGIISGYGPFCWPGCVNPRLVPGTEGEKRWPDPGEPVTFTAHVKNHGLVASPPFSYTWSLDGTTLVAGTLPAVGAGATVSTSLTLPWPHDLSPDEQRVIGEHTIAFSTDPGNQIAELTEINNLRQDRTDALAFFVWISQNTYDLMKGYLNPDGETYAFEDWEQWHVDQFNRLFAEAVFPLTPAGVSERIRLDQVRICPTDTDCYTAEEHRHPDGTWAHTTPEDWYLQDILIPGNPDWALLHEWGHQLGLIDLYWIGTVPYFNHVQDRTGYPYLYGAQTRYWNTLMSTVTPVLSEHTAFALERNLGRRRGFYGEYLLDIPAETRLRVLDAAGQPVSGAEVKVYQVTYDYQWMDQDLRFSGSTDAAGEFGLGAAPFGPISIIGNNAVLFATLFARGQEAHFWLDVPDVNVAYWGGQTDTAVFEVATLIPPAGVSVPAAPQVGTKLVGNQLTLAWEGEPGLSYHLYRASNPGFFWHRIVTGTFETTFSQNIDPYLNESDSVRYAVSAVDGAGHASVLASVGAPVLIRPEGIAIDPAGRRLIVDNHHREVLLQRTDGAFVGKITSCEEWSSERFDVASDSQGYLYLQGGDTGIIHLFDPDHHLLGTFAENLVGSRGLAYLGEGYAAAHDMTVLPTADDYTLLLAYLDGSLEGEDGEIGTGNQITYVPGYHNLGVELTGTATLTYPASGNIQTERGAVEMWVRPLWDGNDGGNHTLFWWSGGDGQFHLRKDAISNLVFDYFYPSGGCGAPAYVGGWKAGDWHHLAFTWETGTETEIALYVDGRQTSRETCGGTAQPTDPHLFIGSDSGGGLVIEAVVDDLRISSVPRVGASDRSHLFVAGGNRVTVLDGTGRFVSQLEHPAFSDLWGLAAAPDGRLWVADAGANRIQILQFDRGTGDLTYLGSLGEGFLNAPHDATSVLTDWLAVADTGNARVVLLDLVGNLVSTYTTPYPPYDDLPLVSPRSVAVDPTLRLVVSDRDPARVVELGPLRPYRVVLPLVMR
jgi:sugar lactone lactonase YvrE